MAYLTETFIADSNDSKSGGGWVNPSYAWDGSASTFALFTAENGNYFNNYLDVAFSDMTSVSDIITKVEVGVKIESDVGEGFFVLYPITRTSYYRPRSGIIVKPSIEPKIVWKDITQYIAYGDIQRTWTRNEVEKVRALIYLINPKVFEEIDVRVYEVYLRVTYYGQGTVSESTSGRFYTFSKYTKDPVNGVLQVSTRGTFTMSGSSTPDGDGWYGYNNDGFFNESIDPVWNQNYTTDGTAVEGKYNLELTAGEGPIPESIIDSASINGIYQEITPGDRNIDVRLKISEITGLEYPTPPPYPCDSLGAYLQQEQCLYANIDMTGYSECIALGGDPEECLYLNFDTTGYLQCLLDSTTYQNYLQCDQDYEDSTAYQEYLIESEKYNDMGVGLMVRVDEKNYAYGYCLENKFGYRFRYYINTGSGFSSGGASLSSSQYLELPYFFRIVTETIDEYKQNVKVYAKTNEEDEWEQFINVDIGLGSKKEIWIFAHSNEAPPWTARIDWFGGTDRYINDRKGVSTLGVIGLTGDPEWSVT
jgi:hypothetical protein